MQSRAIVVGQGAVDGQAAPEHGGATPSEMIDRADRPEKRLDGLDGPGVDGKLCHPLLPLRDGVRVPPAGFRNAGG